MTPWCISQVACCPCLTNIRLHINSVCTPYPQCVSSDLNVQHRITATLGQCYEKTRIYHCCATTMVDISCDKRCIIPSVHTIVRFALIVMVEWYTFLLVWPSDVNDLTWLSLCCNTLPSLDSVTKVVHVTVNHIISCPSNVYNHIICCSPSSVTLIQFT